VPPARFRLAVAEFAHKLEPALVAVVDDAGSVVGASPVFYRDNVPLCVPQRTAVVGDVGECPEVEQL
jgi:hypothetical protein